MILAFQALTAESTSFFSPFGGGPRYVYHLVLCFQPHANSLPFFAYFLRVQLFIFNILQTLLRKYGGWGAS
jgi:hypothetical protein